MSIVKGTRPGAFLSAMYVSLGDPPPCLGPSVPYNFLYLRHHHYKIHDDNP